MGNANRVGQVARKAWRNWEAVRHLSDRASTVLRIVIITPEKKAKGKPE